MAMQARLGNLAGDLGPPERLRTLGDGASLEPREATGGVIITAGVRVRDATPLARYLERGIISEEEYAGGDRLRCLWDAAVRPPRVTMAWGERIAGGKLGPGGDSTIDARWRLWRVLAAAELARSCPDESFRIVLRSGEVREELRAPVRLTPAGALVIGLVAFEERPGGSRPLKQVRDGLGALARVFGLIGTEQSRGRIRAAISSDAKPRDVPESRDLTWAARQNERRSLKTQQETKS